ncbi:MAG: hypothetical protein K6G42_04595 [Lachnospiraceae bacterium]|nr:hypothetical protein [Lachnospiraceae bacterium]
MDVKTGAFLNRKYIFIIIAVAIVVILSAIVIVSIRNSTPHEIDSSRGPKPFDIKNLKTNIAPISEEAVIPVTDDDMEMEY